MRLYLVQHGEACATEQDPERPLTKRGRTEVARLAAFLQRAGIAVERVMHSGKLRAAQTAAILSGQLAPTLPLETAAGLKPNDDPAALDWSGLGPQDTLIVGHLPFMARAVAYLVSGEADRILTAYRPGSIVALEAGEAGSWSIGWMLRPELLPE